MDKEQNSVSHYMSCGSANIETGTSPRKWEGFSHGEKKANGSGVIAISCIIIKQMAPPNFTDQGQKTYYKDIHWKSVFLLPKSAFN